MSKKSSHTKRDNNKTILRISKDFYKSLDFGYDKKYWNLA